MINLIATIIWWGVIAFGIIAAISIVCRLIDWISGKYDDWASKRPGYSMFIGDKSNHHKKTPKE